MPGEMKLSDTDLAQGQNEAGLFREALDTPTLEQFENPKLPQEPPEQKTEAPQREEKSGRSRDESGRFQKEASEEQKDGFRLDGYARKVRPGGGLSSKSPNCRQGLRLMRSIEPSSSNRRRNSTYSTIHRLLYGRKWRRTCSRWRNATA